MNLYVVGAAVIAGLGLASYGLYQRGEAISAKARVAEVTGQRDTAVKSLEDSEETNEILRVAAKTLDGILTGKDLRIADLVRGQRALKGELNELKKDVPQADKDCLDRDLPASFADRLRGP